MKRTLIATALAVFSVSALANDMIIYPAQGQSIDQQRTDRAECQMWATDTTGVDPVAMSNQSAPRQEAVGGERARGALGGAIAGAAIGAIAGDASKGAAIGAGAGAISGGAQQRESVRNNQQNQQRSEQERAQQMSQYNRAFSACLTGRGYSIS